jgi:hypothetical protein
MLAKTRKVVLKSGAAIQTPLLLPSFSSKALQNESVDKIVEYMAKTTTDEVLVSAYDLHHEGLRAARFRSFASVVFLDSGGYEATKDTDLSDTGENAYSPGKWTLPQLQQTLNEKWDFNFPTVLVSYDSPHAKTTVEKQISRAKKLFSKWPNASNCILFKTERKKQEFLDVGKIINRKHELASFDLIGVTEKELGRSTLERMVNIARLRKALQSIQLETPIHVFGSLDTISSPLYFLAGADIFDGLTWLRYAFHEGNTVYKHNYGAKNLGIRFEDFRVNGKTWNDNYFYLMEMKRDMHKFLFDGDFDHFTYNASLLNKLNTEFEAKLNESKFNKEA